MCWNRLTWWPRTKFEYHVSTIECRAIQRLQAYCIQQSWQAVTHWHIKGVSDYTDVWTLGKKTGYSQGLNEQTPLVLSRLMHGRNPIANAWKSKGCQRIVCASSSQGVYGYCKMQIFVYMWCNEGSRTEQKGHIRTFQSDFKQYVSLWECLKVTSCA